MKKITLLFTLAVMSYGYSQGPLPYDFGTVAAPTTHGIISDPNDPVPIVIVNDVDPDDANNSVLSITGNGSEWDNAQVTFTTPIDLSDNENNVIKFKFRDMTSTSFPSTHALKFEAGTTGDTEVTFTANDNDWHTIELDYPGGLGTYSKMVIFTDFGVAGPTGTYLIDDIEQTGAPCVSPELSATPIDFSDPEDSLFIGGDGAGVSVITDPGDAGNDVLQIVGNGQQWDHAQVTFCNAVDLSDDANNTVRFKMRSTTAGAAEVNEHLLKFELGDPNNQELTFQTVGQDWTDVEVNYGAGLGSYGKLVLMVDWGGGPSTAVVGTYLVDDMTVDADVLGVENYNLSKFKAYPNPTTGDWNILGNTMINKIAVYNVLGKQVIALEPNANEAVINASSLNTGIYFARIEGQNGIKTIKLIKE